jgi:hypothetical protein
MFESFFHSILPRNGWPSGAENKPQTIKKL